MAQVASMAPADYVRQITSQGYECRELTPTGPGASFTGENAGATQVVNVVFIPK
jgi:hypothetical protein